MILSLHSIAGAVLAVNSRSVGEAMLIGLASHYFFDSLPHIEYRIEHIKNGDFKIARKEFLKILIDLIAGLSVILFLIWNVDFQRTVIVLAGAFFAILPDGLVFLDFLVKNKEKNIFTKFLFKHSSIHSKIHSGVSNKTIATASQVVIVVVLLAAIFTK